MIAALFAATALAGVGVADHHGQPSGDGLVWTSTFVMSSGETCADLVVETELGAEVCAERPGGRVTVQTSQAFPADRIGPPIAEGGLQRVRVRAATLRPAALDKGMLAYASAGVSRADRRRVDRALGSGPVRLARGGLYVDPKTVGPQGVEGRVAAKAASGVTVVGVAVVFAGVLGLLALGYRGLAVAARRERVQRWIRETDVEEELKDAGVLP